jgi:hypothetical protein
MFCPNRECPDFVESGEPGEYRDDIEICPKCGARLVHEPPTPLNGDEQQPEGVEDGDVASGPLVAAAWFEYRQDADVTVSMLTANGVWAVVFADDGGGTLPHVGFGTAARVMVPERQAALALELLAQHVPEDS